MAPAETLTVTAEAGFIQAQSGERSFNIGTKARCRTSRFRAGASRQLTSLAPGVTLDANNTPTRVGGGGSTNIMMDGVSANDTGSNRPIVQVNVESIAEVKVLTSGYQAEYGRNSGVQVTAVTKSGTNRFHGSVYDVERNSAWNANSKTNILNGDPKTGRQTARLGVLARRAGGQARRRQQAVLLLRAGVRTAESGQRHVSLSRAHGARTCRRLFADLRSEWRALQLDQGSELERGVLGD